MCLYGIKLNLVPHEQWPQCHADHPEQQAQRKENSKRLRKGERGHVARTVRHVAGQLLSTNKRRIELLIHRKPSVKRRRQNARALSHRTITSHAKNEPSNRRRSGVRRGIENPHYQVSRSKVTGETARSPILTHHLPAHRP